MQPCPSRHARAEGPPPVQRYDDTGARLYTSRFVLLLCVQLTFGLSFSTFFLLPKFLTVTFGATPSAIGVVTAMFGLSGLIAIPVVGSGIDRYDRRLFVRLGSVLMAVAAFGYVFVDNAGALASLLRLAQGLAWAMVFTASLALTSETAPPRRLAEAIGVLGAANLVTNALAPAVAEPLADRLGYGPVFALAGLAAIAATGLSLRLRDPVRLQRGAGPALVRFMLQPAILRMAAVVSMAGMAFGVMFTYAQPLALREGAVEVRSFFIAYTAGAMCVRVGLGSVADRLGRRLVAVGALGMYGASVIAMGTVVPVRLGWFGFLFGVAHGFFFPAFNALLLEAAHAHERGKLMTISNSFFSIGSASVIALGFTVERLGYAAVFCGVGLATMAAALLLVGRPRNASEVVAQN